MRHRINNVFLLFLLFLSSAKAVNAQTKTTPVSSPYISTIYTFADEMPKPTFDVQAFLADHLHYPLQAKKENISGQVIVKFVINEDSSVSNVMIVKGIGGGCDEEAQRVVEKMPKWIPARIKGSPVKIYFNMPINFQL